MGGPNRLTEKEVEDLYQRLRMAMAVKMAPVRLVPLTPERHERGSVWAAFTNLGERHLTPDEAYELGRLMDLHGVEAGKVRFILEERDRLEEERNKATT